MATVEFISGNHRSKVATACLQAGLVSFNISRIARRSSAVRCAKAWTLILAA